MMTLGQAARLAGVGKTTLTRAIKAGRLSATRRENGGYSIDPSELARVYSVTPETLETVSATGNAVRRATPESDRDATPSDPDLTTRLAVAEAELRAMKDMLAEIRQSRDDWKAQAERLALTAPVVVPSPAPMPA
jgi:excisionase family DNA binding protein